MMKRSLVCIIAMVTLLFTGLVSAAPITIIIDGKPLTPDVPAQLINDRTMVPLRFISTALGAEVGYDAATNTAIVRKGVTMGDINKAAHGRKDLDLKLEINGQLIDAQLVNVNDRVLVPLRVISETLNTDVNWDEATSRVIINKKAAPVVTVDPATAEALNILTKANEQLAKLPGYTINGHGTVKISNPVAGSVPPEMNVGMDLSGVFQNPDKFYLKENIKMAGLPVEMPDMVMEMVANMKENVIYVKAPGMDKWMKTEAAGMAQASQISPEQSIQMLKDAGIKLTTENKVENGQSFVVIKGEMDGAKLYGAISGLMDSVMPAEAAGAGVAMEETMKSLHGTFTYWVNAQTYAMVKTDMEMSMTIKADEGTIPMSMVMNLTYGNGELTIPTITPEMIAPTPEIKLP